MPSIKRFKFRRTAIVCVLLSIVGLLVVWYPLESPPLVGRGGSYAVNNVNVVDVSSGEITRDMTILVDAGLIIDVIASEDHRASSGFRDIAARGKFVIPGLWDMHTHSLKLSPQIHHSLFISKGVTGVRDMSGCLDRDDSYWACPEDRRVWTQQSLAGARISPRYVAQSSYQTNGGNEVPGGSPGFFSLSDEESAQKLVDYYLSQGVDFIKPYTQLSLQQYDNLVRYVTPSKLELAGHKPLSVSLEHAIESGQKSIEHGRLFLFECYEDIEEFRQLDDPIAHYNAQFMRQLIQHQNQEKCDQLMEEMAQSETWWVPTLTTLQMGAMARDAEFYSDQRRGYIPAIIESLIWDPDAKSAVDRGFDDEGLYVRGDFFDQAKVQLARAHQLGVKILAGTDNLDTYVFTGTSLHDELQMMVDAGLSPLQALQTATINPAIFTGLAHQFGAIEKGMNADFLLLNSNPLIEISATRGIHGLIFHGRYFDTQALQKLDAYALAMAQSIRLNIKFLWSALASPLMRVQLAD